MRYETVVTCEYEGRDKGKRFRLTEMDAVRGERWALRAFNSIKRNTAFNQDQIEEIGKGGFAALNGPMLDALAAIPFAELEPLLAEMFTCVHIINGEGERMHFRPPTPDDIEEIKTRLWLRMKVFELHTSFTPAGAP